MDNSNILKNYENVTEGTVPKCATKLLSKKTIKVSAGETQAEKKSSGVQRHGLQARSANQLSETNSGDKRQILPVTLKKQPTRGNLKIRDTGTSTKPLLQSADVIKPAKSGQKVIIYRDPVNKQTRNSSDCDCQCHKRKKETKEEGSQTERRQTKRSQPERQRIEPERTETSAEYEFDSEDEALLFPEEKEENYHEILAETRRKALAETLDENERLYKELDELKKEHDKLLDYVSQQLFPKREGLTPTAEADSA